MKSTLIKSLSAASLIFALGSTAHAQVMTENTITGTSVADLHTAGVGLNAGEALTQTFTGVASFDLVTFRFVTTAAASFGSSTLDYALSQWAGAGAFDGAIAPVSGTSLLTTAIADSSSWVTDGSFKYFDAELDLSSVGLGLSVSNSYGLSLVGTASSAGAGYLIGRAGNPYAGGSGYFNSGPVTNFTGLVTGNIDQGLDLAFAGSMSPVPEASSAAVLFSGLFVGTMMFSRSRRRRVIATA